MNDLPDIDDLSEDDLDRLDGDLTAVSAPLHDPVDWNRVVRGVRMARLRPWSDTLFWAAALAFAVHHASEGPGILGLLAAAFFAFRLVEEALAAYREGVPFAEAGGEELLELLEREYRRRRRGHLGGIVSALLMTLFFGLLALVGKHPAVAGGFAAGSVLWALFNLWRFSTMRRYGPERQLEEDEDGNDEEDEDEDEADVERERAGSEPETPEGRA